ncbi:MAG TPA: GNAT family N-acetyltransferase [Trebonia sp.]
MITLTTERLTLRQPTETDVPALAEMNGDPEVMRYIGDGTPYDSQDHERARASIARAGQQWADHGHGMLSVLIKETGEYTGWVTLAEPKFLPEVLPAVEIGWRFRHGQWGHGYATEAARALLDFAFTRAGLDRVVSIRNVDNVRSGRVMEKLGLQREFDTVIPDNGVRVAVHAISAPRS